MIQTSSNFAAFNTLALYRNQPCEVTSTRGHKDRVVCDRAGLCVTYRLGRGFMMNTAPASPPRSIHPSAEIGRRLYSCSSRTTSARVLALLLPTNTQPASPPTSRHPSAATGLRLHASSSLKTSARVLVDCIAWVVKPASPEAGVNPDVAAAGNEMALIKANKLRRAFMMNSHCEARPVALASAARIAPCTHCKKLIPTGCLPVNYKFVR